MKFWINTICAMAALAFASIAKAESAPLNLGYINGSFGANIWGNYVGGVTVYCDGQLVVVFDTGGVTTYTDPNIYWTSDGSSFQFYNVPSGNYTATFSVFGNTTGYSYSTNTIQWTSGTGLWEEVDFY